MFASRRQSTKQNCIGEQAAPAPPTDELSEVTVGQNGEVFAHQSGKVIVYQNDEQQLDDRPASVLGGLELASSFEGAGVGRIPAQVLMTRRRMTSTCATSRLAAVGFSTTRQARRTRRRIKWRPRSQEHVEMAMSVE